MLFLNKKKLFQLDRRLQTCASMVRENHVLADIGTDHAYLPIWLVKKEVIKKAIASDINMGPLQKAAFNIRRYNVGKPVSYTHLILSYSGPGWSGHRFSAGAEVFLTVAVI